MPNFRPLAWMYRRGPSCRGTSCSVDHSLGVAGAFQRRSLLPGLISQQSSMLMYGPAVLDQSAARPSRRPPRGPSRRRRRWRSSSNCSSPAAASARSCRRRRSGTSLGLAQGVLGVQRDDVLAVLRQRPVIRPVLASSVSPAGRPSAANFIGRSPLAAMVNSNGWPGRTPKTRAVDPRRGRRLRRQHHLLFASGRHRHRLLATDLELRLGPVGIVVGDVVPLVLDDQNQRLHAGHVDVRFLGGIAFLHRAAFPKVAAVAALLPAAETPADLTSESDDESRPSAP